MLLDDPNRIAAERPMKAVFPIIIVILGLSARDYADARLPGGLEHADGSAIVRLAIDDAMAGIAKVSPEAERFLRDEFSPRPSTHRKRHVHRSEHRGHGGELREHQRRVRSTNPRVYKRQVYRYVPSQRMRVRIIERQSSGCSDHDESRTTHVPGHYREVSDLQSRGHR